MENEFVNGTRHPVVAASTAQALPNESIVLPVLWPDDGRPRRRPVWREVGDGNWTDGRTSSPRLADGDYFLLYVPRPPLPEVGAQLNEDQLGSLPVQTVIRDSHGWMAQLHHGGARQADFVWIGPMTEGASWEHSELMEHVQRGRPTDGMWLAWLPAEDQEVHRRADFAVQPALDDPNSFDDRPWED